mgnify:CR=1 FL=1
MPLADFACLLAQAKINPPMHVTVRHLPTEKPAPAGANKHGELLFAFSSTPKDVLEHLKANGSA